jgi:hypothetical protein
VDGHTWRDRVAAEARQRREEIVSVIQDELLELREVEGVLRALGIETEEVPLVSGELLKPTEPPALAPEREPEQKVEPEPEEDEKPSDIGDRVVELLVQKGPMSAAALRQELDAESIGNVLFELEEKKQIHRSGTRERGTGRTLYEVGKDGIVERAKKRRRARPPTSASGTQRPSPSASGEARGRKKKRGIQHPGADAMPEHLREMPAASKNFPLKSRIEAAEKQLAVYKVVRDANGPVLGSVVAVQVYGNHEQKANTQTGKYLRDLAEVGIIKAVGKGFAPWQEEMRKAGKVGVGRQSTLYDLGPNAPDKPPGDADPREAGAATQDAAPVEELVEPAPSPGGITVERVRDVVVRRQPGEPFAVSDVLEELSDGNGQLSQSEAGVVEGHLDHLVAREVLRDASPMPDLKLYEYMKPEGPGKAALLDMERKQSSPGYGGGSGGGLAVAGTGRQSLPSHPGAKVLVQELRTMGYDVSQSGGSGHWVVTGPGIRRILISGTPSGGRTVKNDRTRLRRAGVMVATS